MSSVVKLQGHTTWHLFDGAETTFFPFSFSPMQVQGFSEYQAVYSHFRILKVVMTIDRPYNQEEPDKLARLIKYAVVPSRTFAAVQPPFHDITNAPLQYVPGLDYDTLAQTKWFKERTVTEIKQAFRVGFYPYTMVGTFGPASVGNAGVYQRVWEGKRWMPFSWAWQNPANKNDGKGTTFWGPYLIIDGGVHEQVWNSISVHYTMYVKFKGQK